MIPAYASLCRYFLFLLIEGIEVVAKLVLVFYFPPHHHPSSHQWMIIATPVVPNDATGSINSILTIQATKVTASVPPGALKGNGTISPNVFIVVFVVSSELHSVVKVKTVTCWIKIIWSYILFSLLLWYV